MAINYFGGLFVIVNTFIALYILAYAFIFLSRTKKYPDRKPWELLFVGSVFFLISQIIAVAVVYGIDSLFGFSMQNIKIVTEFIYAILILVAFVTQAHLILLSDMILITKKVKTRKREEAEKTEISSKDLPTIKERKMPVPDDLKLNKKVEDAMKDSKFESEFKSEDELLEEEKNKSKKKFKNDF